MKKNENKLSKAALQSLGWTLAVVIAEVITYIVFVFKGIVEPALMSGSLGFFIVSVINAICCFFIVKDNPLSIVFTPLIINALVLMMAFFNATFWFDPWWVPVASGWVLCIMASIIGMLIRKRISNSHIQLERG